VSSLPTTAGHSQPAAQWGRAHLRSVLPDGVAGAHDAIEGELTAVVIQLVLRPQLESTERRVSVVRQPPAVHRQPPRSSVHPMRQTRRRRVAVKERCRVELTAAATPPGRASCGCNFVAGTFRPHAQNIKQHTTYGSTSPPRECVGRIHRKATAHQWYSCHSLTLTYSVFTC
jgi:hypothetical protein